MKNSKTNIAAFLFLLFVFRLEAAVYTYDATIDLSTPSTGTVELFVDKLSNADIRY